MGTDFDEGKMEQIKEAEEKSHERQAKMRKFDETIEKPNIRIEQDHHRQNGSTPK